MKHVPIQTVKPNPNNPRKLDAAKFEKLKKSLQEFPEMLEKRPLVIADGFVLGGNMRLRAAQELKFETVPVIDASEWTQEQRDQFLIKDNVSFGEWDWDVLANEWDPVQLEEWGLDVWQPSESVKETEEKEPCACCGR
jgi:ParB-like chromosome segregation protein Spo0J